MLTRALVLALMFALPVIAAAQTEKPITDLKALAGTWNGWYNPVRGGQPVRAQVVIKDDGAWTFHPTGLSPTKGRILLADGKARYEASVGDPGTVELLEKEGK